MSRIFLNIPILLILLFSAFPPPLMAQQRHGDLPIATQWQAYSTESKTSTGAPSVAVLWLEPDKGWYTYTQTPGGFAKPTRITATIVGSKTALLPLYPPGKTKQDLLDKTSTVNVYDKRTPIAFLLPAGVAMPVEINVKLDMLLCTADKCVPTLIDMTQRFTAKDILPGAQQQPWWPMVASQMTALPSKEISTQPAPLPATTTATVPASKDGPNWAGIKPQYYQPDLEVQGLTKAILLGLLAGFILNFMPCVLPVISIKLSALLAGSGGSDERTRMKRFREHNLYFALGALLYFLALSLILGLTGLAWGQIFQKPPVVLALTALIFTLALSLFGVFSLPIVDLKFDQMTTHPKLQALFTGLLATLLATPCSGPFLGGVLGWTLLQPPWVISTVLLCVGIGMALPYLLMSLFPGLVRRFPKPGAWTGTLEKVVGLFLLGTCVYLLGILPQTRLIPALLLLWLTAVAAWLFGEAGPGWDSTKTILLKLLALGFILLGIFAVTRPRENANWETLTPSAFTTSVKEHVVIIDFTADWCPSCKVLEQTTLSPGRMAEIQQRYDAVLLKADLTENNPDATALLTALGSSSIPVLAIFPKGEADTPLVLRDLFTPTQLEDALKQATRK